MSGPRVSSCPMGLGRRTQNKSALRRLDLGEEIFQSAHLHVNIAPLAEPEAPRRRRCGGRRDAERSSDCQFCLSKPHKSRTSGQSADKGLAFRTLRVLSHKLGFGAGNGVRAVQLLLDSWTRSVQLFRTTVPSLASS